MNRRITAALFFSLLFISAIAQAQSRRATSADIAPAGAGEGSGEVQERAYDPRQNEARQPERNEGSEDEGDENSGDDGTGNQGTGGN